MKKLSKEKLRESFSLLIMIGLMFFTSGCSGDEPESNQSSDSLRLKSIVSKNDEYSRVDYKYDSQGRITEIKNQVFGNTFKISYSPLKIVYEMRYERFTLSNIKQNSRGFVIEADVLEEFYSEGEFHPYPEGIETEYFRYDSEDHLISAKFESEMEDDATRYIWDGDLLISVDNYGAYTKITYTDIDSNGQCIPFWNLNMMDTGLFGKVPAKLIASFNEDDEFLITFDYTMDPSNKIKSMIMNYGGRKWDFDFKYY